MNHKFTLIARILLGLIFTVAAIAGLIGQLPPPEGIEAQAFMVNLFDSGLLVFVKIIELVTEVSELGRRCRCARAPTLGRSRRRRGCPARPLCAARSQATTAAPARARAATAQSAADTVPLR